MIQLPKVYAITDVGISGLPHAEQVALLCAGGATLIQLRAKNLSGRDFFEQATQSLLLARGFGAKVLINDRADVALAAGADGIHLGQRDLPPSVARRLLGNEAIIGLSTHNITQIRSAELEFLDYLAIGPIFNTATKDNPDPVVGLETLRAVREMVDVPLVAIGGITEDKAASVLSAGADSVALISSLLSPKSNITERTRLFLANLAR